MKRIIVIAAISGIISSIIAFLLFVFVLPSGWLLFFIPAIMGICIQKFGKISAEDVEEDDKLEKRVGYMCAGAVLFFIILTIIPITIFGVLQGAGWELLKDIPFYIVCVFAVWFGYNRGVRAVVDAYYDSNLKDSNGQ